MENKIPPTTVQLPIKESNEDYSYLKPAENPQHYAVNEVAQKIQNAYPNPKTNTPKFEVNFGNINNTFVDNRMKSFDNSTPFLDVYKPLSDGSFVSMYPTYVPGTDNNERLAQNQTKGEKWVNGVEKALLKTGSAVLGGTAGIVYGLGSAINNGNISSLYDNDFSNKLADLDAKLGYQLPNYYTKQEQDKGLFGQMGTANFWADKFLGGLSFTAGAIVSEAIWAYATGGTSLATMGIRKFGQGARVAEEGLSIAGKANLIASETEAITKYAKVLKDLGSFNTGARNLNGAINIAKGGEFASTVGFMMRSAGYEASVEALQYKREAKDNFYANFESQNGRPPEVSDIQEFEKNLESGANTVFGVNMAILGVSNLAMFGNTFGYKSPINTGIGEFIEKKAFGVGIEKTAKNTFKALEATKLQKVAKFTSDYVVKPGFTEGLFEEGGQGVIQKYNNKWLEHTYDSKKTNTSFESMGAMYESLGEQYGTKEGWVENGLGILIGIIGGATNTIGENKAEKEQLDYKIAVSNKYATELQPLLLGNKVQVANRMQGFSEDAKIEAQKGNLAKSALHQQSGILTYIDAKQTLGESIEDTLNEISQTMENVTEEQYKALGITDIQAHKEETLANFKDLATQWKKNNTYWQYMVGKKLVGEQSLNKTALEDVFGKFSTNAQIVKALAWQSVVGENAHKQMHEMKNVFSRELGEVHANTMAQLEKLKSTDAKTQTDRLALKTRHESLIATRDRLTKLIETLNSAPKETEGNTKQGDRRAKVVADLLKANEDISSIEANLEKIANKINSANTESEGLVGTSLDINFQASTISTQGLLNLEKNLEAFKNSLTFTKEINPQKYQYISDLMDEYSQMEDIFRKNQATQKVIISPDFKMENIGGWISSKTKSKKAMNENTQEWLQTAINDYSKSKTDILASETTTQETAVVEEVVDNSKAVPPKAEKPLITKTDKLEFYKQRIKDIFKSQQLEYTGDYTDYTEPTQAEIEEFRELNKTADKGLFTERYNELKDKLSQWKALDSYADQDNQTIADIITLINQLEQEVEQEQTKDEHTQEDIPLTTSDIDGTSDLYIVDLLMNVNAHVKVKRPANTNNYRISHLKLSTIVSKLITEDNQPIVNGKAISFKEVEVIKPGTILTISNADFKVVEGGAIEISIEDFNSLSQPLNMFILRTIDSNWSYKDMVMWNGVTTVKVPSDFTEPTINQNDIYSSKEGDVLSFEIGNEDGWNIKNYNLWKEAEEKLNKSKSPSSKLIEEEKKAREYFKNQIKIYAVDSKGNRVSTLKSTKEGTTDDNFLRIKERAFQNFNPALDKIDLKVTTTITNIYLGSPQVSIIDGKVNNLSFTDKALTQVVATGYMENSEVKTNREFTDGIDTSFIEKIAKRNSGKQVPFIIIKKGSRFIAYPISMIKTSSPKIKELDAILNQNIAGKDKVLAINDLLQKEQINIEKLAFTDLQDDIKMEEVRQALEDKKTFLSATDLADNKYKIEDLKKDAEINIDLEDLDNAISDPKIRVSFEEEDIEFSEERDIKNNNLVEIEDKLNELAIETYNDFIQNASSKYLDSKGNILEDTLYTDTFDETPIQKVNSNLEKIGNINTLKKAFSTKLPKIVENALGANKVKEIKDMIKQYDFILSQTIVKTSTFQNGVNKVCP